MDKNASNGVICRTIKEELTELQQNFENALMDLQVALDEKNKMEQNLIKAKKLTLIINQEKQKLVNQNKTMFKALELVQNNKEMKQLMSYAVQQGNKPLTPNNSQQFEAPN